jgi:hypothetical protein
MFAAVGVSWLRPIAPMAGPRRGNMFLHVSANFLPSTYRRAEIKALPPVPLLCHTVLKSML